MALNGYTKLSSAIIGSTIWREPSDTRVVWITMLALANADGLVEASVPGLADLSRVTLAACEDALRAFQSPDPYSRTPDHDGRRIEPVEGGWLILNHERYRERENRDERREYLRVKKQESRQRERNRRVDVNNCQQPVNTVDNGQPKSTEAEAEAEALPKQSLGGGANAPAGDERDRRSTERRKTHNGHVSGFCDWICLPKRLREQFAAQSGEDISTSEKRKDIEDRVELWAKDVRAKWEGQQIGDSMWDFWKFRWREFVGSTTDTSRRPVVREYTREYR